MKLNKIFALGLAALTLTACSDDDDNVSWNTNPDVTVQLGEQSVLIKENKGMFFIPIEVKGERNGNIRVTVEVEESAVAPDTKPAVEDANYIITTKSVVISPDQDSFNLQLATVDDPQPGDDLSFALTISNVEYANLGPVSRTIVQINDKGASPMFDALPEKWDFECYLPQLSYSDGSTRPRTLVSWHSTMGKTGEMTEQADKTQLYPIAFSGFLGEAGPSGAETLNCYYRYDPSLAYGDFFVPYGSYMSGPFNFSFGAGNIVVGTPNGTIPARGGLSMIWNFDYTGFTYSEQFGLVVALADSGKAYGTYDYVEELNAVFAIED